MEAAASAGLGSIRPNGFADQMVDSTIVHTHQRASYNKKSVSEDFGHSRGGLTTKIHAVVDTNIRELTWRLGERSALPQPTLLRRQL